MSELFRLLRSRIRTRPSDPMITWYGPGGERAELSALTFGNAVNKTAALLQDGLDAEPGDRILLELPLHWQLPVWLAAADVSGLWITVGPTQAKGGSEGAAGSKDQGGRGTSPAQPPATVDPGQEAVAFAVYGDTVAAERSGAAVPILTSLSAFGLPGARPPDPIIDHAREAMGQSDSYSGQINTGRLHRLGEWPDTGAVPREPRSGQPERGGASPRHADAPDGASTDPGPDDPRDTTGIRLGRNEWLDSDGIRRESEAAATEWGLAPGGRLLCTLPTTDPRAALAAWAIPLLLDASVVLVQSGDPAETAAHEIPTAQTLKRQ